MTGWPPNPACAIAPAGYRQTGFSDDDLELLWKSLEQMFEHDRSAARGQMSAPGPAVVQT